MCKIVLTLDLWNGQGLGSRQGLVKQLAGLLAPPASPSPQHLASHLDLGSPQDLESPRGLASPLALARPQASVSLQGFSSLQGLVRQLLQDLDRQHPRHLDLVPQHQVRRPTPGNKAARSQILQLKLGS